MRVHFFLLHFYSTLRFNFEQTNLMEQVNKLTLALRKSVSSEYKKDPSKILPDDILEKIRDQLVSVSCIL